MRKHFLFFLLAMCFPFLQMGASENAVKIEPTSLSNGSGTSYAIRFDDKLLGEHVVGSSDNDNRTREFTMSAWVKPINQSGHIMGHRRPASASDSRTESSSFLAEQRMMAVSLTKMLLQK